MYIKINKQNQQLKNTEASNCYKWSGKYCHVMSFPIANVDVLKMRNSANIGRPFFEVFIGNDEEL